MLADAYFDVGRPLLKGKHVQVKAREVLQPANGFSCGEIEKKKLLTVKGKCPFKFHVSLYNMEERICLQ